MAGNSEEDEAGAGWLAPLFADVQAKLQEAKARVCKENIEDVAGAVKVARALGVIARSACAVDALRQRAVDLLRRRAAPCNTEDEMGGRIYDPAEDELIRQKLLVESARIERLFESKGTGGSGWRATEAGGALAGDAESPAAA